MSFGDVRSGTGLCLSYVSTDVEVSKRVSTCVAIWLRLLCERCRSEDCSAEDRNGQEAAYVYEAPPRCVHDQCGTGYMVGGRCVHVVERCRASSLNHEKRLRHSGSECMIAITCGVGMSISMDVIVSVPDRMFVSQSRVKK